MKKKLICAAAALMLLAGCSSTDSSSEGNIKVKQTVVGEIESSSESTNEREVYGKNNITDEAQFNLVKFGDKEVDIYFTPVSDFQEKTGLQYNVFESIAEKNDSYSFTAKGYSRIKNEGENSTYGSTVFVEASWYYRQDDIIPDIQQSDWLPKDCVVKGIIFDINNKKDDFDVTFLGNIKLGDKKDLIEKKLGKGMTISSGETAYKNEKNTFIIRYDNDKISRVTIINNSKTEDTSE